MKAFPVNLMAITVFALAVASVGPAQAQAPKPIPAPNPASINNDFNQETELIVERTMRDAETAKWAAKLAAESAKFRTVHDFGRGPNHELDAQIRQAAAQVRDANDDAERAAATADLTKLMDQYFKADIRVREQELADIAARLEKLRAQLDRRREKMSEIIELQIKVAINEADGLGFYSQPKDDGMFNFRIEAPVMVSPSGNLFPPPPAAIPVPPPVPTSADAPPAGSTIPR